MYVETGLKGVIKIILNRKHWTYIMMVRKLLYFSGSPIFPLQFPVEKKRVGILGSAVAGKAITAVYRSVVNCSGFSIRSFAGGNNKLIIFNSSVFINLYTVPYWTVVLCLPNSTLNRRVNYESLKGDGAAASNNSPLFSFARKFGSRKDTAMSWATDGKTNSASESSQFRTPSHLKWV